MFVLFFFALLSNVKNFSDSSQVNDQSIDYYENFDLENIVTPVNVQILTEQLKLANYDTQEIEFLHKGFTEGFNIGYKGPSVRQSESKNIPIKEGVGSKTELWNKLMKEVKLKRVAGPFKNIPFKNYIQSPIGLIPKAGNSGKTRLIFHLSYDFNKKGKSAKVSNYSLNKLTPKEICSVKYNDLDYAVRTCLSTKEEAEKTTKLQCDKGKEEGEGVQDSESPIYLGKTDVQSAFRILGLSKKSWPWLIMKAEHPVTGETFFFIDKCLPFGVSISCSHFQCFSNALKHLIEFRTRTKRRVMNYLDDFLFVAISMLRCNFMIKEFLKMCEEIGVPIAAEKTEWASRQVIYLRILLDGEWMILVIPEEKKLKAINMLKKLLDKKKATIKELQILCGFLNFLNKAIHPGRVFTRRMYAKYSKIMDIKHVENEKEKSNAKIFSFKQYHHIKLDKEFKHDCQVWLDFLTKNKLERIVNRPMLDLTVSLTAAEIRFYSDASAAETLGFRCIFQKSWIFGQWEKDFIKTKKPSIEYLELFALCTGIFTWQHRLQNCRIVMFCDNQAVINMINNITSSCKHCMLLL